MTENFLYNLYDSVKKHRRHAEKAQGLVTIIEIKQNKTEFQRFYRSLYLDTKEMLKHYVISRNGKDYGYDQLDNDFIKEYIEQSYFTYRQQISLYNKVEVELKAIGEDTTWIKDRILNRKLKLLKKENKFKYLIVLSGKSKISCLITLALLFFVECIIILPAVDPQLACFHIKYADYCSSDIINHIANVWAIRLDWIEGPKISCLSTWGIILITLWLILYLVFVANIIFKNLFDKIDLYEISE